MVAGSRRPLGRAEGVGRRSMKEFGREGEFSNANGKIGGKGHWEVDRGDAQTVRVLAGGFSCRHSAHSRQSGTRFPGSTAVR